MNYGKLVNLGNEAAVFIAEAGINHDGSLQTAKKMIDAAVFSKADYVKFQSFVADKLVTPDALTSSYINQGSYDGESYRDLLRRLQLSKEDQAELKRYCDNKNIGFLSTAFDRESFDELLDLGIDFVKVASGELTNIPLLRYMAKARLPMVVSTGMAALDEIKEALTAITQEGNNRIILMHCICWYPAEIEDTNLNYMQTLRKKFGFPVGFSDHSLGINMSLAARVLGAVMVEKHFTLNAKQFGPDHSASIEPSQMKQLVKGIREIELGLGTSERKFCEKELEQRKVHRKSIVVKKAIKAGEIFTRDNLIIKRPGIGIEPKHWDKVLGRAANKDLEPEQLLSWADLAK